MYSLIKHTKNTKKRNAKHLVIFVHGFTGNDKTFKNSKEHHLYKYLDNEIYKNCNFYSFIYYSRLIDFKCLKRFPCISKFLSSKLNHNVKNIADLLKTHYTNNLNNYETINFICHSLGGIIVKQLIIDIVNEKGTFKGFYITLATPHRGIEETAFLSFLNNDFINTLRPLRKLPCQVDSLKVEFLV